MFLWRQQGKVVQVTDIQFISDMPIYRVMRKLADNLPGLAHPALLIVADNRTPQLRNSRSAIRSSLELVEETYADDFPTGLAASDCGFDSQSQR
jgi:hypothetical protein